MDAPIRRAMVTGASRGIGEQFVRQLAARGVDPVLVARSADRLDVLAAEVADAHGCDPEVRPADLTDPAELRSVEDRLRERDAAIDLLVNNAGFGAYGRVAEISRERQSAMVALNVTAVVRLTHAALPGMRERGRGGVINVSSTAAFQPGPWGATYGASKAFVQSFTEAVHEEVGEAVRVMALAPGITTTGFQDEADVDLGGIPESGTMDPGAVVATALRDFTRGRAVSVPGPVNKLSAAGASFAPSTVTRRVAGLVHRRFAGER